MPFDADAAIDRLRAWAAEPPPPPPGGWPAGAPAGEYRRTPAAARVGRLAARDGLFLFHFERRAHLPLPEAWVPAGRPELAEPPRWKDGVLEERKYQSFRHDLAIGGFHPLHRGKWTAHELCHGLVGFGWRPGASRFFHATAGRLAELLPVTLWYFLDEAFLARCADHQGGGALFRAVCPACEAAAATRADDPSAPERVRNARRFLDRELAAIARSRRLGRPVAHRWATLDLCSDGLSYADAHGERLDSEAFLTFAARFLVEGGGWSASLDDLEERVVEVARALVGEVEPRPLAQSATHARWRWVLQDVAWRLLQVQAQAGPAADALDEAVMYLAGACDATRHGGEDALAVQRVATDALGRAAEGYEAAHEAWVLPAPSEVFGVGYELLPGLGVDEAQVEFGVRSAAPGTAHLLGGGLAALLPRFVQDDAPSRVALGARWAAFLDREELGPVADLARYEAAVRTIPAGDGGAARALGWSGSTGEVRLAPTAAVHRFPRDVVALSEAAQAEEPPLQVLAADWRADKWLVILREADGEVAVIAVEPEVGAALAALGDGAPLDLAAETVEELADLGAIVPARWSETA